MYAPASSSAGTPSASRWASLSRGVTPSSATGNRPAGAAQRLDRVVELEVLDALLFQLRGGQLEPRVLGAVRLERVVLEVHFVDEVAAQVAFAQQVLGALGGIRIAELRYADVRLDAAFLHRPARRRVVARGRELEGRIAGQRQQRLDAALAEAALAHDQRAALVLQRAGDDLARRS